MNNSHIQKSLIVFIFLLLYTWAVFHYTASAVLTFQRPYAVSGGYEIELWGEVYSYK